ncbi:DUF3109 family protein [Halosquirtibacter laminarini]|uniref:DUF3109 family protein n=1 Tax=Halosquirtibacter laminarini TaxID=3374600 RepID=A0AC61NJD7_9BACT|nr:DUF3109 family protein [Prolixibacteraceae bacterium]
MVEVGNTIVSFDVFQKRFLCDLLKCKGECCVSGDSGAPLTSEEAEIIEQNYSLIEKELNETNKAEVVKQGYSIIDSDGDLVTPIVGDGECVYTYVDDKGCTKCAIEKLWFEKKIDFRKPVSCHLFPIRIQEYEEFDAVNYQELDICQCAVQNGKEKNVAVWQLLKDPLVRKYGEAWYADLEEAAKYIESNNIR